MPSGRGPATVRAAGLLGGDFTNCIGFGQDPAEIIKPNTLGQSQTQSKCLIGGGDHSQKAVPQNDTLIIPALPSAPHTRGSKHPQAGPTGTFY